MSQDVYDHRGYGIDLGNINPKFSNDVEIQKRCNKIFADFGDITIDRHPDSKTYEFLMIIENAHVVGDEPIKIYTKDEAKPHLANAFNYIFDKWNQDYTSDHQMQRPFVNQEKADIIKKTIDHEIIDKADYDYIAGPWYNIQ